MSFSDQIRKFKEKAEKAVTDKPVEIAKYLFSETIKGSPSPSFSVGGYSEGVFMANWNLGNSSSAAYNSSSKDNDESRIMALIGAISKDSFKDGAVVLSNNTPYGRIIEELGNSTSGTGWVKTPPYKMVEHAYQKTLNKFGV